MLKRGQTINGSECARPLLFVGTPQNVTTMLPNDHLMIRHRRPLQIGMVGHSSNQKVPLKISATRRFTEHFMDQKVPLNISAWCSCRILCRLTESCRLCGSWTEPINLLVLNQKALRNGQTISHFLAQTAYAAYTVCYRR